MKNFKNYCKENQKKVVISSVLALCLLVTTIFGGIYFSKRGNALAKKVKIIERKASRNRVVLHKDKDIRITDKKTDEKKDKEISQEVTEDKTENNNEDARSGAQKPSAMSKQSSQPATSTQPAHIHDWQPIYTTQRVQTGTIVHYDNKGHYVEECKACGKQWIPNEEPAPCNCCILGGTMERWIYDYDTDIISPSYEEPVYEDRQVISGYKCSCGATS